MGHAKLQLASLMIHALCKLFLLAHRRPFWVIAAAALLAALSIRPIQRLEFRKNITDLLPDDLPSVQLWKQAGQKFGGLGNLTLVFESTDPDANARAVAFAVQNLAGHPDINLLEWKTEADFYREHKLLYVRLEDLQEIERRVESGYWLARKKRNPLILDLLDETEKESLMSQSGFEDLEQKYFTALRDHLGNAEGTIRLIRIYPAFDITDVEKARALNRDIEVLLGEMRRALPPPGPEVHKTGEMMHIINQEGRLYSHLLDSGKRALALSAAFLLLAFIRLPMGAILAVIPIALALTFTLALASLIWGHLSLVSAPLSLLLSGFGLDGAIKLLDRYREERRKRLSAPVAFETIVLETGPALLTGMLVLGATFLTLSLTRFKGFAEFALFAGIGTLCLTVCVLLVFPCILMVVEPLGLLHSFGKRLYNFDRFRSRPFTRWQPFALGTVALSLAALLAPPQHQFEMRLEKLGFRNADKQADSLLIAAGESMGDPAFFLSATAKESQAIAAALRARKAADTLSPTLGHIAGLEDLLPARQEEKLAIIRRLRKTITPELIASAPEPLRSNLGKLEANWPTRPLTIEDLPQQYLSQFIGKTGRTAYFTFVFPNVDLSRDLNHVAFAEDLRDIRIDGKKTQPSGRAVLYSDLLALIIPDTRKVAAAACLTLLLLVFIDVRSVRASFLLLMPVFLSLLWTLGALSFLDMPLNHFNLVALPACVAMSLSSALLVYHRYLEEGRGSLHYVLRRCGQTLALCTLVGMATFAALPFSDHEGLRSLGVTAMVGLLLSQAAVFLFMPAFIGYLEIREAKRPRPESPSEILAITPTKI
jgi:uncharacterized protein